MSQSKRRFLQLPIAGVASASAAFSSAAKDAPPVDISIKVVLANHSGELTTGTMTHSTGCLQVKLHKSRPGRVMLSRIADSIDSLQFESGHGRVPQDRPVIRKNQAVSRFNEGVG